MAKWSIPIRDVVKAWDGDLRRAALAIAVEVFTRLVMRSPVDTGRFRGNWMLDVGAVPQGAPYQGGAKGQAAQNAGVATQVALQQLAGLQGKRLTGTIIHFTNNLPYAIPLEEGHSAQAPQGIVRTVGLELPQIVAAAIAAGRARGAP